MAASAACGVQQDLSGVDEHLALSLTVSPPAAVAMSDTCSEMSTMRMKFPKVPPLFLGRSLPAAWAATISAPTISSQGKQFDTPELTPRPG